MAEFQLRRNSPNYPERLGHLAAPPYKLYGQGSLEALEGPAVAVIGTRKASPYGLNIARQLGRFLAMHGIVVVSGLARGIDAAAHRGCLEVRGGRPLGVVACGLDRVYPPEHERLQKEVAARGLILSEYGPGLPPSAFHFPQRNRIVAALCHVLVVVEAPLKSGALITVGQALDLGRHIFVVPGPMHNAVCTGNLRLLRDGAAPLCEFSDILEAFPVLPGPGAGPPPAHSLAPNDLAASLGQHGCTVEQMCRAWKLTPQELLPRLLDLELSGRVQRMGDQYFDSTCQAGDWKGSRDG